MGLGLPMAFIAAAGLCPVIGFCAVSPRLSQRRASLEWKKGQGAIGEDEGIKGCPRPSVFLSPSSRIPCRAVAMEGVGWTSPVARFEGRGPVGGGVASRPFGCPPVCSPCLFSLSVRPVCLPLALPQGQILNR
jgi:hypothetical protein